MIGNKTGGRHIFDILVAVLLTGYIGCASSSRHFPSGGVATKTAERTIKIGYINSEKILASYKESADAMKKLNAEIAQWRQQAETMQKEIEHLRQQLESQSLMLSEEKKAEKNREVQDKYAEWQQFVYEKLTSPNSEAVQRQKELMQPVLDKIYAVIHKIGEEEKFDYIFDTVEGNIVFASEDQEDLTDRVLEELDKGVGVREKGREGK